MRRFHVPTETEIRKVEQKCCKALRNLTIENEEGQFCSRVCLMCDRFIRASDEVRNVVGVDELLAVCRELKLEKTEFMPEYSEAVLSCYGIKDAPDEKWKDEMLLSPRSKYSPTDDGYLVCTECYERIHRKSPKKPLMPTAGIAKGWIIGHSPPELECLTPAEMALVSRTRTVAHVFAFFAGQHKSIRGWHTFYEANVVHTMNVLEAMSDYKLPDKMYAVLSGPFTAAQRMRVKAAVQIRRSKVRAAHDWLRSYNSAYAHLPAIDMNNLPEMKIIDDKRYERKTKYKR